MALDDAHALVIGISRYQRMVQLGDNRDAQDMAAVLSDPACCGYPHGRVRTLIDEAATRAAILDALDALARDARETSTVFVYYSGHGARAAGDASSYYLVPVDASNASRDELERTAISNTVLSARLGAIAAGRLTLVLDCCRAAGMADLRIADAAEPLARGRGRVVIAGSRSTGSAIQLPGARDSAMTGHLISGLRGAALGVGGVIRICDLFTYLQQHIVDQPVEQVPVFKAELEENYPIAQLRGGTALAFEVPAAPPDGATYDAFISYCRSDDGDRAWVWDTLVPGLEGYGLRLCLEDRDLGLGGSPIHQAEQAVKQSRYTIAVYTPAYLANRTVGFQSELASWLAIETGAPKMIPLIRRHCELALHVRMTAALDVQRDAEVPLALKRLALNLRQPATPRLTS